MTVYDLLTYYPRGYEDRTKIVPIYEAYDSQTVCIKATVFSAVSQRRINKTLSLYSAELADESGQLQATWFNNKYIKTSLQKGESYIFYGKIRRIGPRKTIENPIFGAAGQAAGRDRKNCPALSTHRRADTEKRTEHNRAGARRSSRIGGNAPRSLLKRYNLLPLLASNRKYSLSRDFETFSRARLAGLRLRSS